MKPLPNWPGPAPARRSPSDPWGPCSPWQESPSRSPVAAHRSRRQSIQYAWDKDELYALVTQPNQSGSAPPLCEASAVGFTPDGQYAAGIDPACIGKPASFAYRATISYDTNVSDENAAYVTDALPDKGMSGRIWAPASSPEK